MITQEGLARLTEELVRLKTDGRRQVAARLQQAVACEAHRGENADYLDACDEQELLERRISVLEERLRSAELVEPRLDNGRIDVGERVRLRDLESDERLEVELVGPVEADVFAGRVSVASPLGKAILGLRRGQIADVDAPRGRLRFKIVAVDVPAPSPG